MADKALWVVVWWAFKLAETVLSFIYIYIYIYTYENMTVMEAIYVLDYYGIIKVFLHKKLNKWTYLKSPYIGRDEA